MSPAEPVIVVVVVVATGNPSLIAHHTHMVCRLRRAAHAGTIPMTGCYYWMMMICPHVR